MRSLALVLVIFASACGMGGSADNSGSPSTFVDAGTGGVSFGGQEDIGEFRGIIEAGKIPAPETLDANGFFNEHYAPPPSSECTSTLCLTPGLSVGRDWLTGAHQATLQIAVNTNIDPTTIVRKPLNLVVVVDHSGSMSQDLRLEKVKTGLHVLINSLQDTDRMALIQFDDRVDVLAPFGTTLDRNALNTLVNGLTPRGGTDIHSGLQRGFQTLFASYDANRQNRVIFLSDGMATVGITDTASILAMADGFVADGIGLTTVGVGESFDVELMRGLAEHGSGNFYFLEDAAAATEVFKQELDFFITPIALDITIEATAGGGYNFGEVVGSTLWQSSTKSGAMYVPAVFVASRTSVAPDPTTGGRRGGGSMLFINIAPTGTNLDGKVADLKLTYHVVGSATPVTQTLSLVYPLDPTETPQDTYLSVPEMAKRYAMYNIFLGLRYAASSYDYNCATVALRNTRNQAETWNTTHEDPDITDDIKLIDHYILNLGYYGAHPAAEATLQTCAYGGYGSGYGSGDGSNDYPNDYNDGYNGRACSAGGKPSGFIVIALAAFAVVRRRRRR